MAEYLLHQSRDGTPLGVFFQDEHYYLPETKSHEAYGVAVVADRGSETSWEDYAEQLASKSPSPRAMWDLYESDEADLEDVLLAARNDTTYGEG
jgi:hypothetical protein